MANVSSVSESNPPPQPASQALPVRIHFTDRFLTSRTHGDSSRSSSISFTTPAQSMLQSRSDNRAAVDLLTEGGRRVRSSGPDPMVSTSKMSKNTPPRYYGSRRRKSLTQKQSPAFSPLKVDSLTSDFEPSAFSDEYDLCEFSVTSCLQHLNPWSA